MTKPEKTLASEQRGPYAEPQATKISPAVKAALAKHPNPEIRRRMGEHIARKTGGLPTNRNHDSDHW
jgi:hypothetical protein